MIRVRAYWAALTTCLFGAAVYWNRKQYSRESWSFVLGKSLVDLALLGILAIFTPVLVFVYSCIWTMDRLTEYLPKDRILRVTMAVLSASTLAWLGGIFMELLLFIGTMSMDLVTGRVLTLYRRRVQA